MRDARARALPRDGNRFDDGLLVEALGMALPGAAAIPAGDAAPRRGRRGGGPRAVDLAERRAPARRTILTSEAFDNAITLP